MKKQLSLFVLSIVLLNSYSFTENDFSKIDNATSITVNATAEKIGEVYPQDWEEIFKIAENLQETIKNTEGVKGSVSISSFDNNKQETA